MGLGQTFAFYNYLSDDGKTYQVKLSADDAAAGVFGSPVSVSAAWPYGRRNMRHIWGKSNAGKRTSLPCASPLQSNWVLPATFNLQGVTYAPEGAIGEKRSLRFIR